MWKRIFSRSGELVYSWLIMQLKEEIIPGTERNVAATSLLYEKERF